MTASSRLDQQLLLLSGGHDSIALAAWLQPDACLTIDYGQLPFEGELRASTAATRELGINLHTVRIDLSPVGSGLLHSRATEPGKANAPNSVDAPSPEWWPYRNQLLVSIAAAWALPRGFTEIAVGSVAPDGVRHKDGTAEFYQHLDSVVAYQEGAIHITAPAINMTTSELIEKSGVTDTVLGYAHSCHTSSYPCRQCPGCFKHEDVLTTLKRLR